MISHTNSLVPTFRADVRYFEVTSGDGWYGGGADLTPYYLDEKVGAQSMSVCPVLHRQSFSSRIMNMCMYDTTSCDMPIYRNDKICVYMHLGACMTVCGMVMKLSMLRFGSTEMVTKSNMVKSKLTDNNMYTTTSMHAYSLRHAYLPTHYCMYTCLLTTTSMPTYSPQHVCQPTHHNIYACLLTTTSIPAYSPQHVCLPTHHNAPQVQDASDFHKFYKGICEAHDPGAVSVFVTLCVCLCMNIIYIDHGMRLECFCTAVNKSVPLHEFIMSFCAC